MQSLWVQMDYQVAQYLCELSVMPSEGEKSRQHHQGAAGEQ